MSGYIKPAPDSITQTGQRRSTEERDNRANTNRSIKVEYGRIKKTFFDKEGTLSQVVVSPETPSAGKDSFFGRKKEQRMQLNIPAETIAALYGGELVGRRVKIEYSGIYVHKGTVTIVEELNRVTPGALDLPRAASSFAGPGGKPLGFGGPC